jgi:hypothetical protein
VVTRARARAGPRAIYLANFARIAVNNLLRTADSGRLASSHCWDGRWWIRAAGPSRNTAFEVGRTGTQTTQCAGATLRGPTAVSSRAAAGLGAAFDVGGSARASPANVCAATRAAFSCGDADTWRAAGASTGTVHNGWFGYDIGMDGVGSTEQDGGEEVGEMHLEGYG